MPNIKLSSLPTIRRLPSYLLVIETAQKEGREFISGTVIADELELEPIQVRKDLALTGIVGKPRLGFPVAKLIDAINTFLDWTSTHRAILIGAGHLGTALSGYPEFLRHGLSIVAACDADSAKIGQKLGKIIIEPISKLSELIKSQQVEIAILTVPSNFAQDLADIVIEAGINAIWNFTNTKLKVPKDVIVQKEDLSSGYAILSVKVAKSKQIKKNFNV